MIGLWNVGKKLFSTRRHNQRRLYHHFKGRSVFSGANQLKSFLSNGDKTGVESTNQHLADLFPNCTVLFCDIVGFTAWSSSRQPDQVFILLQTIYNAYDQIAKRRHVFKVETIGDCYLAVTGLPEPQTNHAMIMARFACECQQRMRELANELCVSLGPGTSDLTMKFGMHSGPVTAGSKSHSFYYPLFYYKSRV
jgi:class 3 adenylate cyclase